MKRKLQLVLLLLVSFNVRAQQNYFVYLQTENKQPFYVKVNSKILSSSSSGYVVIPKLTTGSYPITVGFAKDKWPQQSFYLEISTSDAGYLLKNFNEKGWGLYNIQTMEISMNGEKETSTQKINNEDEAFATTLSGAANAKIDVKTKIEPIKKSEKVAEIESKGDKSNLIANKIEKLSTKKINMERYITYSVLTNNKTDTVDVYINYQPEKKAVISETPNEIEKIKEEISSKSIEPITKESKTDKKFLDIEMQKENSNGLKEKSGVVLMNKPVVSINSDCKAQATEDDFNKTRKKMASQEKNDDMIEVAKKAFKSKCYTVEQIRGLSILFIYDNSKYKFFDAVYPRVSDSQNYGKLQSELKDTYYINRFKVMLRN